MRPSRALAAALVLLAAAPAGRAAAAGTAHPAQHTRRVSLSSEAAQGNGYTGDCRISPDGRWAVFTSDASDLVPGDGNTVVDVFVHDRFTGLTERVNLSSAGVEANGDTLTNPAISADGRWVAFASLATNLVPGDGNGFLDVFVRDRATGATRRVSVGAGGGEGNGPSASPSLSADGRWVAFDSQASNLAPGDGNHLGDVFLHDLVTGSTVWLSRARDGGPGDGNSAAASVSADGSAVAFHSTSGDLVAGDGNAFRDVFVWERATRRLRLVSRTPGGLPATGSSGEPSVSADGRRVAFASLAADFVFGDANRKEDVYVADLDLRQIVRASLAAGGAEPDHHCLQPFLSADGRAVAFHSLAGNLVPGDVNGKVDVFRRDLAAGVTTRVSVATGGGESDGDAVAQGIGADGATVAFVSAASNLVQDDGNGVDDAFVHDSGGLALEDEGRCFETVLLSVRSATPGGAVALLFGPPGRARKPGGPCAGATLDAASPAPVTVLAADGLGAATFSAFAPAAACGAIVQALDFASCRVSNPVVIEPLDPLFLSRSGFCSFGQSVTLRVTGAAAQAYVVFLHGAPGTTVKSGGGCAGLRMDLAAPEVLAVRPANSAGEASFTFAPAAALCGATLQAVDARSCRASNTAVLN